MSKKQPSNLGQLLDLLGNAEYEDNRVSWGAIMDVIGSRSFGPLLLLAGLFTVAPILGDIPGVPTMIGIFLILIVGQLLAGRKHFWLPKFLLNRSMAEEKLHKAVKWMKSPARFIDRLLQPRLGFLVGGAMKYVIAVICLAIALTMPAMELVPFSANLAGAALTAFGLALIADDGVLALIAMIFTASMIGLLVYMLL